MTNISIWGAYSIGIITGAIAAGIIVLIIVIKEIRTFDMD
jgi:hypothetical protein